MLSKALLALLPLLTLADNELSLERALSDGYNYDRCDAKGPEAWPNDCLLQEQGIKGHGTPIDLCGAVAFPDAVPVIETMGYDTPVDMTVSSDGTSIKVTVSDDATRPGLKAGQLATIVGRSAEDTEFEWHLEQMHLHWGRDGKTNEGSEHFMQGKSYAAEAHFVHYNSKYGSFGDAVNAGLEGNDDALLVVGFFLQPGATDSVVLAEMASAVPTISKEEQSLGAVDLSDLMGDLSRSTYYSYAGGLTTPGCWEIVTWIVITEPQSITTATLNALWDLKLDPKGAANSEKISRYGNYRNLQPKAGRAVYLSSLASGRTSAACNAAVKDPAACTRTTSAGLSLVPSLLLPFTVLFLFATVH